MIKYLQKVVDRLTGLKQGISDNASDWMGQPDTPVSVQLEIDALNLVNTQMESLKNQLNQKQEEARNLAANKNLVAEVIEKRAISIHALQPNKLEDYGIAVPGNPGTARPIPAKAIIVSVDDDDDGVGFKIKIQSQEHIDFWEIERGQIVLATDRITTPPPVTPGGAPTGPAAGGGPSGTATVLQPPYPFLKSTKKLTYVDDDVLPGVRYFYRVRGINTKGGGEWSEPVSAVQ